MDFLAMQCYWIVLDCSGVLYKVANVCNHHAHTYTKYTTKSYGCVCCCQGKERTRWDLGQRSDTHLHSFMHMNMNMNTYS